jgi:hypothetical protein
LARNYHPKTETDLGAVSVAMARRGVRIAPDFYLLPKAGRRRRSVATGSYDCA